MVIASFRQRLFTENNIEMLSCFNEPFYLYAILTILLHHFHGTGIHPQSLIRVCSATEQESRTTAITASAVTTTSAAVAASTATTN